MQKGGMVKVIFFLELTQILLKLSPVKFMDATVERLYPVPHPPRQIKHYSLKSFILTPIISEKMKA